MADGPTVSVVVPDDPTPSTPGIDQPERPGPETDPTPDSPATEQSGPTGTSTAPPLVDEGAVTPALPFTGASLVVLLLLAALLLLAGWRALHRTPRTSRTDQSQP